MGRATPRYAASFPEQPLELLRDWLHHFVLIVTPAGLASPVVRREIRLARQDGKIDCPELERAIVETLGPDFPERHVSSYIQRRYDRVSRGEAGVKNRKLSPRRPS